MTAHGASGNCGRCVINLEILFQTVIRDGRVTSLFFDWWCGDSRVADMMTLHDAQHWKLIRLSDRRDQEAWKIPVSFMRKGPQVASLINQQQFHCRQDQVIWIHSKSGQFTIASAYE